MKKSYVFEVETDNFPIPFDVVRVIAVDMNTAKELIQCKDCEKNPYTSNKDTVTVVHITPEHCWHLASMKEPQYCSLAEGKEE